MRGVLFEAVINQPITGERPMRTLVTLLLLAVSSVSLAEAIWVPLDGQDELTDEKHKAVLVVEDEDGDAKDLEKLGLWFYADGSVLVTVAMGRLNRTYPDNAPDGNEKLVSYRTKGQELMKQVWTVANDHKEVFADDFTVDEVRQLIDGEQVIIQFDKDAERFRFDLSGAKGDDLRDHVDQLIKWQSSQPKKE
jgi:hypothetical protein